MIRSVIAAIKNSYKPLCKQESDALKLKSHFAAGALGDSIRFGIFVVYQFHPGT
jgi:hypothetical protein